MPEPLETSMYRGGEECSADCVTDEIWPTVFGLLVDQLEGAQFCHVSAHSAQGCVRRSSDKNTTIATVDSSDR